MNSEDVHARAELRFRKLKQAATARALSMAEYVSAGEKRRILSAKLRALRLAKAAEELAAAEALPQKKRSSRKTDRQP